MEETVFFNASCASVTSSKIMIGNSTYATRNVGSVRVEKISRPLWPLIFLIIGLLICITSPAVGIVIAAVGALAFWKVGPKMKLLLLAGGGETVALESPNLKFVEELHSAIVNAISAR